MKVLLNFELEEIQSSPLSIEMDYLEDMKHTNIAAKKALEEW